MATETGRPPSRAASRSNGGTRKNGSASKAKVATAVAEANPDKEQQPKEIAFRGLKLTLPVELPPALLFDVIELEAQAENPLPVFRLLRTLLGGEQFTAVRNTLGASDSFDDLTPLINDVFGQYGMTLGESSASQGS